MNKMFCQNKDSNVMIRDILPYKLDYGFIDPLLSYILVRRHSSLCELFRFENSYSSLILDQSSLV